MRSAGAPAALLLLVRILAVPALVAGVLAAVLLVFAGTSPRAALAHANYDRSTPAGGAVIPRAPARLDAWFTQEIFRREGANALEVRDEAGIRVDEDDLALDETDRTHLSVGLPADLAAGRYTVAWRTLSAVDGDTAEGSFAFTIDPTAPEPTPTPASGGVVGSGGSSEGGPASGGATPAEEAPTSALTGGGGDIGWWVLAVVAALAASLALGGRALLAGPAVAARGRGGAR